MGCCKLVGEKKQNKVQGHGIQTTNGETKGATPNNFNTMSKIQDPSAPSYKSNMTPNSGSNQKSGGQTNTVAIGVDPNVGSYNLDTQQALMNGDTQRMKFGFNDKIDNESELKIKNEQSNNHLQNNSQNKNNDEEQKINHTRNQGGVGMSPTRLEKTLDKEDTGDMKNINHDGRANTHSVVIQNNKDSNNDGQDDKVFKLPAINNKSARIGGNNQSIENNSIDKSNNQSKVQSQHHTDRNNTNQKSIEQEVEQQQMSKMEIRKEAQRIKETIGTHRSTISHQNMQLNTNMASSYVDNLFNLFAPPVSLPKQTSVILEEEHEHQEQVLDVHGMQDNQQASSFIDNEQRGSVEVSRVNPNNTSGIVPQPIQNIASPSQVTQTLSQQQSLSKKQEDEDDKKQIIGDVRIKDEPESEDKTHSPKKDQTGQVSSPSKVEDKAQMRLHQLNVDTESNQNQRYQQQYEESPAPKLQNKHQPHQKPQVMQPIDQDMKSAQDYITKLLSSQQDYSNNFGSSKISNKQSNNNSKSNQGQSSIDDSRMNPNQTNSMVMTGVDNNHNHNSSLPHQHEEIIDNRSESQIQAEVVNEYISELRTQVLKSMRE
eukprot:403333570